MSRPPGAPRRGLPPAAAGIPVPADKRFRRSDPRLGRRRSWRTNLLRGVLFGSAGLAVLVLLAWAGRSFVKADTFKISRVVVRGNTRLSQGEVRALLDGIDAESIFLIDLEEYRVRVLDSRWVANAALWRVFPSTVEVRLVERTPLAIARLNGQLFLVDAAGVIIDSFGPQYKEFDLPIVDGLLDDVQKSGVADPPRMQLTTRLLGDLSSEPDLFRRVSQIDVSDPRNAVVLLDGEPARLSLGDRQFLDNLHRYLEAADRVRAEVPAALDSIDVRYGQLVVRPVKGGSPDARDPGARK